MHPNHIGRKPFPRLATGRPWARIMTSGKAARMGKSIMAKICVLHKTNVPLITEPPCALWLAQPQKRPTGSTLPYLLRPSSVSEKSVPLTSLAIRDDPSRKEYFGWLVIFSATDPGSSRYSIRERHSCGCRLLYTSILATVYVHSIQDDGPGDEARTREIQPGISGCGAPASPGTLLSAARR